MPVQSRVAVVLGAGASWAAPAGRPLFGPIAAALFDGIGVAVDHDRRWLMAPEALLSRLADRGVDIDAELRSALGGGAPNALHYVAAGVLERGGSVWTTNFDELVEDAASAAGVSFHCVIPGENPTCGCSHGHVFKVHGTLTGDRVIARSEEVLEPLPGPWLERLRADFDGASVALVGYAGADVDLRSGLRAALGAASSAAWFARNADEPTLTGRFSEPIATGALALALADRPDLAFLEWAADRSLTGLVPAAVAAQARGPLPATPVKVSFDADCMLRALVADDFGDFEQARREYRRAVLRGPQRRRATASVFTTGLIHGAVWRPGAVAALRLAARRPGRVWPVQQLLLYLTWNGHTAEAWELAKRELATTDTGTLRLQAANVAKEVEPAAAVGLATDAQADALAGGHARRAAWATLCLSLALRWTGDIDRAATEAARLADGLDALAAPVWRAWGHFELGAVATLRGDGGEGTRQMRLAREVFVAAGAHRFVYDALCGEVAAARLADPAGAAITLAQAQSMLDDRSRTSRFAREVLLVEVGELARRDGRLDEAQHAYEQLRHSPTVAQQMLGLLGLGEVQRARGIEPIAARDALDRSLELSFAFGVVHAAITLGLAGVIDENDAEALIATSIFDPPERPDRHGLVRFCLGAQPELHPISFP